MAVMIVNKFKTNRLKIVFFVNVYGFELQNARYALVERCSFRGAAIR